VNWVYSHIKFSPTSSHCLVTETPQRWDEYLDLPCPVIIGSECGAWESVWESLRKSGLNPTVTSVRVVEVDGRVWEPDGTETGPTDPRWALILNWTHPEEGWRWNLPLAGRTYVVTRQKEKAANLVSTLEAQGARALAVPTITFIPPASEEPVVAAIRRLEEFRWIIFTSPNGVRYFFQYLHDTARDHRALARAKFACIGPGTARSLAKHGFKADLIPKDYVAEGLLRAWSERVGNETRDLKALIPRAQEARSILPDTLREWGAEVEVVPVYKTVQPSLPEDFPSFMNEKTRLLFTSSSTVKHWCSLTGKLENPCICIGPVTAATAENEGLRVLAVAPEHTIEGLLQCVLKTDSTR